MEAGNVPPKGFKQKFLNKKVLLIFVIIVILLFIGGIAGFKKISDNPAFCTACHNMQPYYDSWKDSDLLANSHAAAGVECHDCHESSLPAQAQEGVKYITGDYKTPLDKREYPREFCTRCHDFEKVKAATDFDSSNPHDSHNGDLECYKCHSMHEKSTLLCEQCHSSYNFEWIDDLPAYWN